MDGPRSLLTKQYGNAIHYRYNTIFLAAALPIYLLHYLLPHLHFGQLIAGWGIFWYGIFRYWLRDLQLDDDELTLIGEQNYLWSIPIILLLANLVLILIWLMLLSVGDFPIVVLPIYSLFASGALAWTVARKSIHRRRRQAKALQKAVLAQTGQS